MLFILLFIISVLFNDKFCITWGLGIGDWGLGIAQSPIPNPLLSIAKLF